MKFLTFCMPVHLHGLQHKATYITMYMFGCSTCHIKVCEAKFANQSLEVRVCKAEFPHASPHIPLLSVHTCIDAHACAVNAVVFVYCSGPNVLQAKFSGESFHLKVCK